MRLADLVACSNAVAATRARGVKTEVIAATLAAAAAAERPLAALWLAGQLRQHLGVAGVAAVGEVGLEERVLQLRLAAFEAGPVQQPVGVEGVVDAGALRHVEREAHRLAALADGLAVALRLRRGGAVLLGQMLGNVLPFGRHAGVQFERLEMQARLDLGVARRQGGRGGSGVVLFSRRLLP